MNIFKRTVLVLALPLLFISCDAIHMAKVAQTLGEFAKPTSGEAANGLKEALKIGFKKGVSNLSVKDGFWGDAAKRIFLPKEIQNIESDLKKLPIVGKEYDRMMENLNHGAEEAVGLAKDVFIDAVTQMTLKDAMGILTGGNGAATSYLKKATTASLTEKFKPVIQKSLDKVGVTKNWKDISSTYNIFASKKITTDLNAHVTSKAMETLFKEVEKQENAIRSNPVERTSDLLKKVFGYADSQK